MNSAYVSVIMNFHIKCSGAIFSTKVAPGHCSGTTWAIPEFLEGKQFPLMYMYSGKVLARTFFLNVFFFVRLSLS